MNLFFFVEDNKDNFDVISTLLRELQLGRSVGRPRGSQIFEWISKNPQASITVIFLDIQIPHEDGFEILKQLRDAQQKRRIVYNSKEIPTHALDGTIILAVTASVTRQNIEEYRKAGFDGFIGKPLEVSEFGGQVQRVLARESVWE